MLVLNSYSHSFFRLFIALIALLVFSSCRESSRESHKLPFPTQKNVRLLLPPTPDERLRQLDHYLSDGKTRMRSAIEYRNGVSEEILYWNTGLRRESRRYYPARADAPTRQVRSHALYRADGHTFVSHEVYREDGTLERCGKELADGTYESIYYFGDGFTVERLRRFDRNKKFVSERTFRRNGTRLAEITPRDSEIHIILFDASEVRRAAYFRNSIGDERGTVYGENGESIHIIYQRDRLLFEADYYDDQGLLVQRSRKVSGVLQVSAIDANGFFRQEWRDHRHPDGIIRATLSAVQELGEEREVIRTIQMSRDGLYPVSVEYAVAVGKIIHVLKGSTLQIASVESYDLQGNLNSRRPGIPGELETLSPSRLEMPARDPLPSFDDFGPAWIYDYEVSEKGH